MFWGPFCWLRRLFCGGSVMDRLSALEEAMEVQGVVLDDVEARLEDIEASLAEGAERREVLSHAIGALALGDD